MSAMTKEDLQSDIEHAKIEAHAEARDLVEKAKKICDNLEIDFSELLEEWIMSSYMVRNDTINRIVSYVLCKNHSYTPECIRELKDKYIIFNELGTSTDSETNLMKDLVKLNKAGVFARYGNKKDVMFEGTDDYKFKSIELESREQTLKSIHCFLYQCNEGNVPKKKLYKQIEDVAQYLSADIIESLPAYQNATWE